MTNAEIVARVAKEVEAYFAHDLNGLDLGQIEDLARDKGKEITRVLLQESLDRRCAAENAGYRGNCVTTPAGQRGFFQRYEQRELMSYCGALSLTRAYYWVPGDQQHGGYAPLDDELGLNDHEATPALQRGLRALGVEAPFAKAGRLLAELNRISVAPRTIAEVTEDHGAAVRAHNAERVREAWRVFEGPTCTQVQQQGAWRKGDRRLGDRHARWSTARQSRVLYVQCDGGRVNTLAGWKEPKVAVLFADSDRAAISHERGELIRKEYVATMSDITEFQRMVWEAGLRWGSHKAARIVVLGDGAEGFQRRLEELYPEALQILDWYHAAEHLWEVARLLHGVDTPESKAWADPLVTQLRAGGVDEVIRALTSTITRKTETRKKIDELIGYYTSNRCRMRYHEYEAQGLFIGSGAVESGVKNVVNIRMKGCGMRWDIDRADRFLATRARYLSSDLPLLTPAQKAA
jgi:hypothetical protein